MRVFDIEVRTVGDECELRAYVKCETDWVWGSKPFPLFFRVPREYERVLDPKNGDPFVAALLAPAMVLAEQLEVDAPISARLRQAIPTIQAIYRQWNSALAEISLDAPVREVPPRYGEPPSNTGLFYSLGIDSSYSLLKNVRDHGRDEEAITHLVNVSGFDIYLWETHLLPAVRDAVGRVADALGKRTLLVATNLRDFSDRIVDWVDVYHGGALASVALVVEGAFRTMRIAASTTYSRLFPLGSHPLLDPLWSTEGLAFLHDGCEASRLEKVRLVARSRPVVENLRVCVADPDGRSGRPYNCGRCPKCLRTAIYLHIMGALEHCATLPHDIDVGLVRRLRPQSPSARIATDELIAALGSLDDDLAIKAALEECRLGGPLEPA